MKIRMLKSQAGSPDGVAVTWYKAGEEYEFKTESEIALGGVFLRERWGESVKAKAILAAPEDKDLGAAPANKLNVGGAGRKTAA